MSLSLSLEQTKQKDRRQVEGKTLQEGMAKGET